jgi:hypothetical protein
MLYPALVKFVNHGNCRAQIQELKSFCDTIFLNMPFSGQSERRKLSGVRAAYYSVKKLSVAPCPIFPAPLPGR